VRDYDFRLDERIEVHRLPAEARAVQRHKPMGVVTFQQRRQDVPAYMVAHRRQHERGCSDVGQSRPVMPGLAVRHVCTGAYVLVPQGDRRGPLAARLPR
jgi:hypothetical protein